MLRAARKLRAARAFRPRRRQAGKPAITYELLVVSVVVVLLAMTCSGMSPGASSGPTPDAISTSVLCPDQRVHFERLSLEQRPSQGAVNCILRDRLNRCDGYGFTVFKHDPDGKLNRLDLGDRPFWATWWFRGSAVLLLLVAVAGGYRLWARSIAARSRQLEAQVASRTRELAALNAIITTVSQSLDLDEILGAALGKTLQVIGIESGGIYLLDKDTGVLTIAAQRGFSPRFVAEIDRLKVGEGFSGRVVQSGKPLVAKDVSADPRLTRLAVQEEGLHSLASVPLVSKGKVLGALFAVTHGYREFTAQDIQLLESIGHQVGAAIESARLYEDTKSQVARLTALQETAKAVASTLELDKLLGLIVQQATTLLQADGGIINLVDWDKREDEVVATTGLIPFVLGEHSPLEGSLSGWVTLHNQPIISNQISSDDRVDRGSLSWVTEECIQSAAVAPLTVKDRVMGTLVVIGQEGGKGKFVQADLNLLVAFANQAATAIENVRLFCAEQRRAEQFRVIGEVGRHITSILDVDELLREIVRLLREAFGYYLVTIGLIEGDQVIFKAGLKADWPEPQFCPAPVKVGGKGITAWVAATGEPLLASDVSREPRYLFWPATAETRSELAVPLKTKTAIIGVLNVESDHLDAFDVSDLTVLQFLAHQAVIAIENARLYEQGRQLAVVEERNRLARDLHDSVTQSLYSSTLLAEAGLRLARAGDQKRTQEYMARLGEIAQQALKEMRLLVYELRPLAVKEVGLLGALQQRLDAVERRAGVEAHLVVEGQVVLPATVEEELYRIAQEALNNALKHAAPTVVTVTIRAGGGRVELEVLDDGKGFDPQAVSGEAGIGLASMQERAEKLGAILAVASAPGKGTTVKVTLENFVFNLESVPGSVPKSR